MIVAEHTSHFWPLYGMALRVLQILQVMRMGRVGYPAVTISLVRAGRALLRLLLGSSPFGRLVLHSPAFLLSTPPLEIAMRSFRVLASHHNQRDDNPGKVRNGQFHFQ